MKNLKKSYSLLLLLYILISGQIVNAQNEEPECQFHANWSFSQGNCLSTFTNTTTFLPGSPVSLQFMLTEWDMGDGTILFGNQVVHDYALPGTYMVRMITWGAGEHCCYGSRDFQVTVNTVCNLGPCAMIQSGSITNPGIGIVGSGPITATAYGIPTKNINDFGYYWDFGDGSFGSGRTVDHTYSSIGNKTVSCTYFWDDPATGGFCSNTFNTNVYIASTSSWKTGGSSLTSTESLESNKDVRILRVFPNPSNGLIEVKIENGDVINTINVLDLSGRSVYKEDNISSANYSIDLSFLKNGMYIILANENDTENRIFNKIVIK